jgi:glycosyltransferase, family 2
MQDDIQFSVVIPTYNSRRFIESTLLSVFQQSYLPNEICIVDDGSTDGTLEEIYRIVNESMPKNITLKVEQQTNQGAGSARNKAISMSTSPWVAFLDSDDLWDKEKLAKIRNAIEENPGHIIYTHNEESFWEGNETSKKINDMFSKYKVQENLFLQLYRGNIFSTSCMVVSRKIVNDVGGFNTSLLSAQDYDLWIRLAMKGSAYILPDILGYYVLRKDNISIKVYRRYCCEIKIAKIYKEELENLVGVKSANQIYSKRIFRIHKSEFYLALKAKRGIEAVKILLHLPLCF